MAAMTLAGMQVSLSDTGSGTNVQTQPLETTVYLSFPKRQAYTDGKQRSIKFTRETARGRQTTGIAWETWVSSCREMSPGGMARTMPAMKGNVHKLLCR